MSETEQCVNRLCENAVPERDYLTWLVEPTYTRRDGVWRPACSQDCAIEVRAQYLASHVRVTYRPGSALLP